MMFWVGKALSFLTAEYMKDYRESRIRAYELIVKNNMHLNQIILTVSIASLAAVAALNKEIFVPFPIMSYIVLVFFILTILFSTINFYLTSIVLQDIQRKLAKDISFPVRLSKGEYQPQFRLIQKVLNILVFGGFCLGLILLLVLLGYYTVGMER